MVVRASRAEHLHQLHDSLFGAQTGVGIPHQPYPLHSRPLPVSATSTCLPKLTRSSNKNLNYYKLGLGLGAPPPLPEVKGSSKSKGSEASDTASGGADQ